MNCVYFVCACIIYVHTPVKINGEWKSAFRENLRNVGGIVLYFNNSQGHLGEDCFIITICTLMDILIHLSLNRTIACAG